MIAFPRPSPRGGFTLLELLVVVAIIAIMAGLIVMPVAGVVSASRLNGAARGVVDELNLARQYATAHNTPVEVRFYKLPDYSSAPSGTLTAFRAMQLFSQPADTLIAVDKPLYFSSSVVFLNNSTVSSLLSDTNTTELPPGPSLATYGTNYRYRSFRFKPSGGTDMADASIFVTVAQETDKLVNGLPSNFYTIQIDAVSGRASSFQP